MFSHGSVRPASARALGRACDHSCTRASAEASPALGSMNRRRLRKAPRTPPATRAVPTRSRRMVSLPTGLCGCACALPAGARRKSVVLTMRWADVPQQRPIARCLSARLCDNGAVGHVSHSALLRCGPGRFHSAHPRPERYPGRGWPAGFVDQSKCPCRALWHRAALRTHRRSNR